VFIFHLENNNEQHQPCYILRYFNVFTTNIKITYPKTCLMIAALVKYTILPPSVITDKLYLSEHNETCIKVSKHQTGFYITDLQISHKQLTCEVPCVMLPLSQDATPRKRIGGVYVKLHILYRLHQHLTEANGQPHAPATFTKAQHGLRSGSEPNGVTEGALRETNLGPLRQSRHNKREFVC
jgi:hypothetical protein